MQQALIDCRSVAITALSHYIEKAMHRNTREAVRLRAAFMAPELLSLEQLADVLQNYEIRYNITNEENE